MPNSETGKEIASKPESLAIQQALDIITNSKKRKDEIVQSAVANLANLNVVDELMKVHSKQESKDNVFGGAKENQQTLL